jgi:hypothetical protein
VDRFRLDPGVVPLAEISREESLEIAKLILGDEVSEAKIRTVAIWLEFMFRHGQAVALAQFIERAGS